MNRDQVVALGRVALFLEAGAVLASLILALLHSALARSPYVESFALMSFLVFLVLLAFAVLSGPGMFLSRPRLIPLDPKERERYRQMFAGAIGKLSPEYFDLLFYTGLSMLFLLLATGLARILP